MCANCSEFKFDGARAILINDHSQNLEEYLNQDAHLTFSWPYLPTPFITMKFQAEPFCTLKLFKLRYLTLTNLYTLKIIPFSQFHSQFLEPYFPHFFSKKKTQLACDLWNAILHWNRKLWSRTIFSNTKNLCFRGSNFLSWYQNWRDICFIKFSKNHRIPSLFIKGRDRSNCSSHAN